MITALRTTLKAVTLNTNLATATAPTTLAQPTTLPTLSGDKLRTMLNSSRASGDPVLVAGGSVSTANNAKTVNDAIKDFVAIAKRIESSYTLQQMQRDLQMKAIQDSPIR